MSVTYRHESSRSQTELLLICVSCPVCLAMIQRLPLRLQIKKRTVSPAKWLLNAPHLLLPHLTLQIVVVD